MLTPQRLHDQNAGHRQSPSIGLLSEKSLQNYQSIEIICNVTFHVVFSPALLGGTLL